MANAVTVPPALAFGLSPSGHPLAGATLTVGTSVVTGGGYLSIDQEKGEYAGLLELSIQNKIALKAIGILTVTKPGQPPNFSLFILITAEFNPIQLGYGFTLNGIGGLLGVNRTMVLEAMQAGLKSGGLDLAELQVRWQKLFAERGIAEGRIVFEGWSPHRELLDAYNRVDLALDTQPYSGGLTTCEALWMGVPVLTWPGKTLAGRHSVSHLTNAGYPEFVAADRDAYVELAVQWANRLQDLAAIRAEMRDRVRRSPLCDADRFARDLLALLRQAWESRIGAT